MNRLLRYSTWLFLSIVNAASGQETRAWTAGKPWRVLQPQMAIFAVEAHSKGEGCAVWLMVACVFQPRSPRGQASTGVPMDTSWRARNWTSTWGKSSPRRGNKLNVCTMNKLCVRFPALQFFLFFIVVWVRVWFIGWESLKFHWFAMCLVQGSCHL